LAAKHPFSAGDPSQDKQNWDELIGLSTDYAALFDVQPYSQFESMWRDAHTIVPFLRELAVYDTLFSIHQIRPADAIKIARGVLGWLDMNKEYDETWSISDVLTIGEQILKKAKIGKCQQGPTSVQEKDIVKMCKGMNRRRAYRILNRILSHPSPGANQAYTKPTYVPGPDFFLRPLLSDGRGKYWLLNASACAPAVIEALFSPLRAADPRDFDKKVGQQIERFLRQELSKKGVRTSGGEYKVNGEDGECDIVIETSAIVIFLEVKKKPLTQKARAGSDAAVLLDLAGSLLDAQLQAGWHEVRLRRQGYIDLVDQDGQSTRLSLNGRGVERIAITLFDYGAFQDRILLGQFLEANLEIEKYSTADAAVQKKFDELNVKLKDLRNQVRELEVINRDPNAKQHPFIQCWFLSIPQLLILLDSVENNEDFKKALWSTRHITTGSFDFYSEFAQMKKFRKAHTAAGHSSSPAEPTM
jgi:hypothetical protein